VKKALLISLIAAVSAVVATVTTRSSRAQSDQLSDAPAAAAPTLVSKQCTNWPSPENLNPEFCRIAYSDGTECVVAYGLINGATPSLQCSIK
jgi:hypothetical protein